MADLKRVPVKLDGEITFCEKRMWEGEQKGFSVDLKILREDGKQYILTLSSEKSMSKGPVKQLPIELSYQYGKIL